MGFSEGSVVTSASGRQFERFDGEGKVLIIRIVDQESVVDGFLNAFGFVTFGDQGTGFSGGFTMFNSGGLGQSFIMGFNSVNNDSPFSISVNSSSGLDIFGFAGAQIGFLNDFLKSIDGIFSVG